VERIGEVHVRQVHRVRTPAPHVGDQRRIARPELHFVAQTGQMDGERRPPTPRTNYCNALYDDSPLGACPGKNGGLHCAYSA
jgi:hypothetical protein